jgi:hypothetical protein
MAAIIITMIIITMKIPMIAPAPLPSRASGGLSFLYSPLVAAIIDVAAFEKPLY